MKSSSLLQHIGIALTLTCLAAINNIIFRQFVTGQLSAKMNISLIVLLYLGYLIQQSDLAAGKITLLSINLGILITCLFAITHLPTLLLIYLLMIWLNRLLLCYSNVLAILADLGLCLISASMVYWVWVNGNSIIAALWCFLLLQALHTLLPYKEIPIRQKPSSTSTDHFNHALQSAESALQQIMASSSNVK